VHVCGKHVMCVCMHVCVHACVCYAHACVCVRMCVCVHVCMPVYRKTKRKTTCILVTPWKAGTACVEGLRPMDISSESALVGSVVPIKKKCRSMEIT